MKDTPRYVYQIQFDIVMSKPIKERLFNFNRMIIDTLKLAQMRIEKKYPFLTYPQLRAEMFREMYRNDFPPDKLAEIAGQIEAFWEKKME